MRSLLTTLLAAVVFFPLTANATDVEGDVWGTWTRENSPYNVIGEIRVPPGSTLVIEPGILVNFEGHYKFIVDSLATLLAVGTETDSIFFTAEDSVTGWHGIRFMYSHRDCQLSYCRMEFGRAMGDSLDAAGGALFCYYSSPEISSNTIRSDSAVWGGGIYCEGSNSVISGNAILENAAYQGAGIYCRFSTIGVVNNDIRRNSAFYNGGGIFSDVDAEPMISANTISDNRASDGGGIACAFSRATISDNIISGNSVTRGVSAGGGIWCYGCSPLISRNVIKKNSADWSGGGICCTNGSDAVILHNIICWNSAASKGGAIYSNTYSGPRVTNNTISANSADKGGGLCTERYSTAAVLNCILWADTAVEGPEIYLAYTGFVGVSYSDVQGGWEGEGNIHVNPRFVGPEREDFHLRYRSPCIDAGVPDSLDPDGTRSDMGAFYFDQDLPGIVELYPHDTPIVIPPEGGGLSFDARIFNLRGASGTADVWTYLFVPDMGRYGPLDRLTITIPPNSRTLRDIARAVPGSAPDGEYVFVAYVGRYPAVVIDSSYFYFEKEAPIIGVQSDDGDLHVPGEFTLCENYPNPFNSTTRINYQLPLSCDVKLGIYNVLGQRVATLVDSKQQRGYKSVVWDASEVSSGLYFYKLTAGDFTETRRMMLVK